MKNNLQFLLSGLLLAALMLQSCGREYGLAFSGNTNGYMAKPGYHDQKSGAVYFSGRFNDGYTYYKGEKNRSFDLSSHVSLMREHFFFSGGLYGYWGTYHADTSGQGFRFTPYNFNGFGMKSEAGVRIPLQKKFDLLAGFGLEFFAENGEYQTLSLDPTVLLGGSISGTGFGLSLDARYSPSPKNCFGLRYGWENTTENLGESADLYIHRFTLHGTFDRVTLFGQIGFASGKQEVFSGGLAYAIPFGRQN